MYENDDYQYTMSDDRGIQAIVKELIYGQVLNTDRQQAL